MKFTSLLFALLFLVAQTGDAQTTKPSAGEQAAKPTSSVRMDAVNTGKGLSDAQILQRADEIRYRALHQEYSNIANALADSKLEVSDRFTALNRLTETYFGNMPETVTLPANLLKPDGSSFSDKEMGDFMTRLTKKPLLNPEAKLFSEREMICLLSYYQNCWIGSEMARAFPGFVVVVHPICVLQCEAQDRYLAIATNSLPFD